MLPPVKKDRIITQLPKCFSPNAALHTKEGFHPQVKAACQVPKADTLNFNIAKVIVVGDVAVGKTCLISRFCRAAFDKNYKATIGVDFEMERFEVLGVPFSLQLICFRWDTAGQERFKCIASTYYRGAQAIIVVFDLSSVGSLAHARQWLEDAMKENDPSSVLLFLVGTKKDLSSPDQLARIEREAIRLSEEIKAEYWAVSAKSGEGVRDFFFRVASLTFEAKVLSELEKSGSRHVGDIIRITDITEADRTPTKRKSNCC
ncbi:ras-related protein Rab-34 isoform X1 [Echeneis naucrates]|uniref:ras-related protein Rab-34 isoform X1 n=1 Tax=Echeneis naucrates TaxID=173247 RepID=UPI0011140700|nr:ras-related protein Rab-34-like isoform X1 [Echeneis naucrates]